MFKQDNHVVAIMGNSMGYATLMYQRILDNRITFLRVREEDF